MPILCFALLLSTISGFAGVGKVMSVSKGGEAHAYKGLTKTKLIQNLQLEVGDEVSSGKSTVIIAFDSGLKVALPQGSRFKIHKENKTGKEKSSLILELLQGSLRTQLASKTKNVSQNEILIGNVQFLFASGDFEIISEKTKIEMNVNKGEVEVRSPDIHTLVPEIIKSQKGFLFDRKMKSFGANKYSPKFNSLF